MGIKLTPLYEQVPLDDMGYKGGWIEIRTNPTGAESRAFGDAWLALINEDADWKEAMERHLRALSDAKDNERAQMATQFERASKERDRKRKNLDRVFLAALAHLLGRCQIENETYPLNTAEGLETFEEQGDPQIIWFGRETFTAHRQERVTVAVDSFRGRRGAGAQSEGRQPQEATVAIADSGRANGQVTQPVPGH